MRGDDYLYLGLYDPTGLEESVDSQSNFHGIHSAVRELYRSIVTAVPATRRVFVARGGDWIPTRTLADGSTLISRPQLATWLPQQRCPVIAHDLANNGLWINTCRRATQCNNLALAITMHSLSYEKPLTDMCLRLAVEPLEKCDRIVVPSASGKVALSRSMRLTTQHVPGASTQMSIVPIPHPVDANYFVNATSNSPRKMPGESADVVFVYIGRLSPADKADLVPLIMAFQKAISDEPRVSAKLVIAGWEYLGYAEWLETMLVEQRLTKLVKVVRTPDRRTVLELLRSSDCMVVMSDSVQETHGLSAIEAMACGIPIIAPAWDGYRDSIRHGIDGWLIPTVRVQHGSNAIKYAGWQHDHYLVHQLMARQVAVSVTSYASAMVWMLRNRGGRSTMGENARANVIERFSIEAVAVRYAKEFDSMAATIREDSNQPIGSSVYNRDPWEAFGDYATSVLSGSSRVVRGPVMIQDWDTSASEREHGGLGVSFEYVKSIYELIEHERTVEEICRFFDPPEVEHVERAIILGIKYGMIDMSPIISDNAVSHL